MTVTDSQTDRSLMQPKMQSVTEGSLHSGCLGPKMTARLAWKPLSASTELVQVEARVEVPYARVDDNQSRPDARGGVDGVELVEGLANEFAYSLKWKESQIGITLRARRTMKSWATRSASEAFDLDSIF